MPRQCRHTLGPRTRVWPVPVLPESTHDQAHRAPLMAGGAYYVLTYLLWQAVLDEFRQGDEARLADLVVCDGAPDVTGMHDLDEYVQVRGQ